METPEQWAATMGKSVMVLASAYGIEVDELKFEAYRIGLEGVPSRAIQNAVQKCLQSDMKFMPPPGQLRQLCLTGGKTYAGRAEIAWYEFDRQVGLLGGDKTVTFADGLINATVRLLGGWIQCCEKTGDEYFVWLQKQFKETYRRLCESGASEELRRPLTGRLEIANTGFPDRILNQLNAYTGHKPVEIGTSQPVIAPPSEAPKRAIQRPNDIPRIELKNVSGRTISERGPE